MKYIISMNDNICIIYMRYAWEVSDSRNQYYFLSESKPMCKERASK